MNLYFFNRSQSSDTLKWTLLSLAFVTLITGCTSYGCKGFPNNPICKSAVAAYKATDGSPIEPTGIEHQIGDESQPDQKTAFIEPNPTVDHTVPIRTPPKIMRVWIAPWEDNDGDLQVSGYLFTELEPRRWMIGRTPSNKTQNLRPLQVSNRQEPSSPIPQKEAMAQIDRDTQSPP